MKYRVYDEGWWVGEMDFASLEDARRYICLTWGSLIEMPLGWKGYPALPYGPGNHFVEIRSVEEPKPVKEEQNHNKLRKIVEISLAAQELLQAECAKDEDWAGMAEVRLINALRSSGYDKYFEEK